MIGQHLNPWIALGISHYCAKKSQTISAIPGRNLFDSLFEQGIRAAHRKWRAESPSYTIDSFGDGIAHSGNLIVRQHVWKNFITLRCQLTHKISIPLSTA